MFFFFSKDNFKLFVRGLTASHPRCTAFLFKYSLIISTLVINSDEWGFNKTYNLVFGFFFSCLYRQIKLELLSLYAWKWLRTTSALNCHPAIFLSYLFQIKVLNLFFFFLFSFFRSNMSPIILYSKWYTSLTYSSFP